MKRFTVIGDTHHIDEATMEKLLPVINAGDFLVHLGDGLDDLDFYSDRILCHVIKVSGNCDLFSIEPCDVIEETEAGRILFTHGHTHYVRNGLLSLSLFAQEKECDFVFYGHTHVAAECSYNNIMFINPGSTTRPRCGDPSYCVVTIENGKLITKIVGI